jgi:protein-tyrosine phosphatase
MTQRHVALDGALNLRDIGGYLTGEGREVRRGCLYRSAELCSLTDADLDVLGRIGIGVVVDLRNQWERAARPDRLPAGVELIERSSPSTSSAVGQTLEEAIAAGDLPVNDDEYFTGVYVDLLDRLVPEVRLILELALDAVERPVLFHCAAGKDRTGLVAAVLLGTLGVPDETIVEDYELTTTHYAPRRLEALGPLLAAHGVTPARVGHLVEARTAVLRGALRHLHERWGGYDGYATAAVGVPPDLPVRLRAALTTPAPAG